MLDMLYFLAILFVLITQKQYTIQTIGVQKKERNGQYFSILVYYKHKGACTA